MAGISGRAAKMSRAMSRNTLSEHDKQAIRACANRLADAARVETLKYFRADDLHADNKDASHKSVSAFDPVTIADRNSERAMRDILAELRPHDAVLGEEFGETPGTSGLTWVLDPIDGTRGYISGTPTWGVLISLRDGAGPFFGVIDQPYIGERFTGGLGAARLKGPHGTRPLRTRQTRSLDQAILYSTFPEVGTPAEGEAFRALSSRVRLTRYGTDCYGYALVALGQIDLVAEAGLFAYDVQAPIAVVQAAGGIVTDWAGAPAHDGGRILAAANAEIHAEALKYLAAARG